MYIILLMTAAPECFRCFDFCHLVLTSYSTWGYQMMSAQVFGEIQARKWQSHSET